MAEDFLSDSSSPDSDVAEPDRESVRLIVVGSRRGVMATIHRLHLKTFANADEWSTLQPEPMTGKWMSVVTKVMQFE